MHPITAKARGLEPAPALAFQVLGLGGAMLGAAALASGSVSDANPDPNSDPNPSPNPIRPVP